ncbi:hypothetical protein HBO03_15430 [Pseudomonas sp. WS 5086]|nr:hypothetical protein [Pseudomonas sp. WS 5086]NMY47193.1 hypothetical protein [Pseudomonas sp. WS 5027]
MLMHREVWTPERIAERDARHDKIDKCIEAGLCYICDQAVADGAALHGPTGAHWECHRAPFEGVGNLSTAIKEIDRLLGVPTSISPFKASQCLQSFATKCRRLTAWLIKSSKWWRTT